MHPELIKAELRMKEQDGRSVARHVGVSGACVSHVIHGRGVSTPVAKRIAEVTGISIDTLWPGKYTKPGRARYTHPTTP